MSQLSQWEINVGGTPVQYQDEGVNLGTAGTVTTIDFTGAGVTATRAGNVVSVAIPGGGGGGAPFTTVSMVKNIPADFPTLTAAIADYTSRVYLNKAQYEIQITAGSVIAEQIILDGVDFSNLHLTALGAGCTVDCLGFVASALGNPAFIFAQDTNLGEITGTFVGSNSATASFLQSVRANTRSGSLVAACSVTGFYIPFLSAGSRHASLGTTVDAIAVGYSAQYNSTLVIASGTTNATIQSVGSVVEVEGGSINGSTAALSNALVATGGGQIMLNAPNVTGQVVVDAGDIQGTIAVHAESVAGIGVFYAAAESGTISVKTATIAPRVGSTAALASALTASSVAINAAAIGNASTGASAIVGGAGLVREAGPAIAGFTGGPSQALYVATANGLIIA